MASRRQQPLSTSTSSDDADTLPDTGAPEPSNIAPAVPTSTIVKLAVFTVAMFAGPLSAYFLSVRTIFAGNATYAGALAAVVANVVVIAYVIAAVWEDQGDQRDVSDRLRAKKAKKAE